MTALTIQRADPSFPIVFKPLQGSSNDCDNCSKGTRLDFGFEYAYQPIVDVQRRTIYAHEALVRGPLGEGAGSVLSQVNDDNRYRFDQACRVKAIKGASALGMTEKLSINFLPNAIYKPELCIRTTLEAARVHGFPLDSIIFEVTEGERVEDGPWFAEILREYQRWLRRPFVAGGLSARPHQAGYGPGAQFGRPPCPPHHREQPGAHVRGDEH